MNTVYSSLGLEHGHEERAEKRTRKDKGKKNKQDFRMTFS
jgi:hypothetical protein